MDETQLARPAPLIEAALMLARHSAYGLVWVDTDLVVSARFGHLTDAIEVGQPLVEGLPALVGLESEIHALRADGAALGLPSISMRKAGETGRKVHLSVYRHGTGGGFLVLIGRALEPSHAEVEVMRQMRLRLIAEAELEQKKQQLERANAELALCNRDLEDFAAVISHDLNAPMRALGHACDDIRTALAAGDMVAADAGLADLKGQSRRMSQMLVELLDYASLGRSQDMLADIDTGSMVAAIIASLPRPAGLTVAMTGDWPTVRTYGPPLDLVIRNLIDNAIKHHDKPDGRVVLAAKLSRAMLSVTVADDGPGIAPRLHEAVFLPFKRVAQGGPPNSTGMGLAFVKRTVETVGGHLHLLSNPEFEPGTTVIVDWPVASVALEEPGDS
ncbi:MAG: HAMP domain-containing sensor histidine kinase [Hyphomicrobiaceae bacterium]|nr:HAMP domain-containing sensor histidine kinase [Hyphomicrobiaceae bacterium]